MRVAGLLTCVAGLLLCACVVDAGTYDFQFTKWGYRFKAKDETYNYYGAQDECESDDSTLMVISSKYMTDELIAHGKSHNYYVGLNDLFRERKSNHMGWQWTHRGIWGLYNRYTNWGAGEPNDWNNAEDAGEIYLRPYDNPPVAVWNDQRWWQGRPAICMKVDGKHVTTFETYRDDSETVYVNPKDNFAPFMVRYTWLRPSFSTLMAFGDGGCDGSEVKFPVPIRSSYLWFDADIPLSSAGKTYDLCVSDDMGLNWKKNDPNLPVKLGRAFPTTYSALSTQVLGYGSSLSSVTATATDSTYFDEEVFFRFVDKSLHDPNACPGFYYAPTDACFWRPDGTAKNIDAAYHTCASHGGHLLDPFNIDEYLAAYNYALTLPQVSGTGDPHPIWLGAGVLYQAPNKAIFYSNLQKATSSEFNWPFDQITWEGGEPGSGEEVMVTMRDNGVGHFRVVNPDRWNPSSNKLHDYLCMRRGPAPLCGNSAIRFNSGSSTSSSVPIDISEFNSRTTSTKTYDVCVASGTSPWYVHQPQISFTHVRALPTSINGVFPSVLGASASVTMLLSMAPGTRIHSPETELYIAAPDCGGTPYAVQSYTTDSRTYAFTTPDSLNSGIYKLCVRTGGGGVEQTAVSLDIVPVADTISAVNPNFVPVGTQPVLTFTGARVTQTGSWLALVRSAGSCATPGDRIGATQLTAVGPLDLSATLTIADTYKVCYSVDGGSTYYEQSGVTLAVQDVFSNTLGAATPTWAYESDPGVSLALGSLVRELAGRLALSSTGDCSSIVVETSIAVSPGNNGYASFTFGGSTGSFVVPADSYTVCLKTPASGATYVPQTDASPFEVYSELRSDSITFTGSPPALLGNALPSSQNNGFSHSLTVTGPGAAAALSANADCSDPLTTATLASGTIDLAQSIPNLGTPTAQVSRPYYLCVTAEGTRWVASTDSIQYVLNTPLAMTGILPPIVLNGTSFSAKFTGVTPSSVSNQVQMAALHPDAGGDCSLGIYRVGATEIVTKDAFVSFASVLDDPVTYALCLTVDGGNSWTRQIRGSIRAVNEPLAQAIESVTPQLMASGVSTTFTYSTSVIGDGTTTIGIAPTGQCTTSRIYEIPFNTGDSVLSPGLLPAGTYSICFQKTSLLPEWLEQIDVDTPITILDSTAELVTSTNSPFEVGQGHAFSLDLSSSPLRGLGAPAPPTLLALKGPNHASCAAAALDAQYTLPPGASSVSGVSVTGVLDNYRESYRICTQIDGSTWVENAASGVRVYNAPATRFAFVSPAQMGANTRPTVRINKDRWVRFQGSQMGFSTDAACAPGNVNDVVVGTSFTGGSGNKDLPITVDYPNGPLYICFSSDAGASYTPQTSTLPIVVASASSLSAVDRSLIPSDLTGVSLTFTGVTPLPTTAIAFAINAGACATSRVGTVDIPSGSTIALPTGGLPSGSYAVCYTVNRGASPEQWYGQTAISPSQITAQPTKSDAITAVSPAIIPAFVSGISVTPSLNAFTPMVDGVTFGFSYEDALCSGVIVAQTALDLSGPAYTLSSSLNAAGTYYVCLRVDSDTPTWTPQSGVSITVIDATAGSVTSLSPMDVPAGSTPVFTYSGPNINPSPDTKLYFSSSASCTPVPSIGMLQLSSLAINTWGTPISTSGSYYVCYSVEDSRVAQQTSLGSLVVRSTATAVDTVSPVVVGVGSTPSFTFGGVYYRTGSKVWMVPTGNGCSNPADRVEFNYASGAQAGNTAFVMTPQTYDLCYDWDGLAGSATTQTTLGVSVTTYGVTSTDVTDISPKLFGTTVSPTITLTLNGGVVLTATTMFALVDESLPCMPGNVDGVTSLAAGSPTFSLGPFTSPSGDYDACLSVDGGLSWTKQLGVNVTALAAAPTTVVSVQTTRSNSTTNLVETGVKTEIEITGATASVTSFFGFDTVAGGCSNPANIVEKRAYPVGSDPVYNVTISVSGTYVLCYSVDSQTTWVRQTNSATELTVLTCSNQASCETCAPICAWCLEDSLCTSRSALGGCSNTSQALQQTSLDGVCPVGIPSVTSGSTNGGTRVVFSGGPFISGDVANPVTCEWSWTLGGQAPYSANAQVEEVDGADVLVCVSPAATFTFDATLEVSYKLRSYLPSTTFGYYSCEEQSSCDDCYAPERAECGWCVDTRQCTIEGLCANVNTTDYVFGGEACPSMTDLNPRAGSTEGGDVLTLTGTLFTTAEDSQLRVTIDGIPVNETTIVSPTEIHCVTPARPAGSATISLSMSDERAFSDSPGLNFVFNTPAAIPKPPPPPLASTSIVAMAVGGLVCCMLCLLVGLFLYRRKREEELYGPPDLTDELRHKVVFGSFGSKKPLNFDEIIAKSGPLLEMLLLPGYEILHAVVSVTQATEADNIAKAVLILTEAHELSVDLQKDFITREVFGAQSQSTMFRTNSFATKMFKTYSKMQGLDYVHSTLGLPLGKIIHDLEVEEQKKKKDGAGAEDEANKFGLLNKCQRIFNTIIDSERRLPVAFREIFAHVQGCMAERFPVRADNLAAIVAGNLHGNLEDTKEAYVTGSELFHEIENLEPLLSDDLASIEVAISPMRQGLDMFNDAIADLTDRLNKMVDACDNLQGALDPTSPAARRLLEEHTQVQNSIAVGGFFFLRFLVPCITAPESYALVKELPTPKERKLLVLIGKVLQNLSNKKEFGNKEKKMLQFNDFIVSNERVMAELFDRLSTVPEREAGVKPEFSHVPQRFTDAAICTLYSHMERLLPKIVEELESEESAGGDAGVLAMRKQMARMVATFYQRTDLLAEEKKATVAHQMNLDSSASSSSSSSFLPEGALVEQAVPGAAALDSSSSDGLPPGAVITDAQPAMPPPPAPLPPAQPPMPPPPAPLQ